MCLSARAAGYTAAALVSGAVLGGLIQAGVRIDEHPIGVGSYCSIGAHNRLCQWLSCSVGFLDRSHFCECLQPELSIELKFLSAVHLFHSVSKWFFCMGPSSSLHA